jgi:hypothetical protein
VATIEHVIHELDLREYRIVGSAVLLASGRALPPLAKILAAHPLIHTADGEFFRTTVRNACARLRISVDTIRERELEDRMHAAFGSSAGRMQRQLETAGRSIGPPWAKDHKTAACAALITLKQRPER